MNYNQLNEYERAFINAYLQINKSIIWIAKQLNRHKSTIYREIKRNGVDKVNGLIANQKAITRRMNSKEIYLNKYQEFLEFFYDNFDKRINGPATLVAIAKKHKLFKLIPSHQSLYNWINLGLLKIKKNQLLRSTNKYKRKMLKWNKRSRIHKIPISLRPRKINTRQEYGHWEGDSVTMANSGHRVMTLVERKTRFAVTLKLDSGHMEKNYQALKNYLLTSKYSFKSITFDNGVEFNNMYKLKNELGVKIYYCHPYTPSERGTNEVWNGFLRRFFPKGTNWAKVTNLELQNVTKTINKTPRKILNWKSSLEVMNI